MSDATPLLDLPYPETTDAPLGPAQIQALAEAIEAQLGRTGALGGFSYVAAEQSRTNVAYGLLGTPDRIQNLTVPAGGLLMVGFQAMVKEATDGGSRTALFLGSNQLKYQVGTSAQTQAANIGGDGTNVYYLVTSSPVGLRGEPNGTYTGDVTTGQVLGSVAVALPGVEGGITPIFMDPANPVGPFDLSVQFKATSGAVTAKERKLWAWVLDPGG